MRRQFTERPPEFEIVGEHPLAQGLVFAGLGRFPNTKLYHDSSLYGNHGTLTNMDPATDWVLDSTLGRWVLDFDRTDDSVAITTAPALSTTRPFTMAAWVYIHAYVGANYQSFFKMPTNSEACGLAISNDPSYLGVLAGAWSSWARLKSGTASATFVGSWHHVVHSYNGAGASTAENHSGYLDGKALTFSNAGAFGVSLNVGIIGWDADGQQYSRLYGRTCDQLAYNGRLLSLSEVQQLADPSNVMLSLGGGDPGLLRYRRKWWPVGAAVATADCPWLYSLRSSRVIGGGTI